MQNIITRIKTRIAKLEAAGLGVTEAEAALSSAQLSINTAVNSLATIDATVQVAVSSEDPRANWISVKTTFQNNREQLRTAHTEIKASVQALKDAAREMENNRSAPAAVQNTESDATIEAEAVTSETDEVTPVE
jgi:Skp family chaperone for outer membrane proteins